jgi:hypothetical protein
VEFVDNAAVKRGRVEGLRVGRDPREDRLGHQIAESRFLMGKTLKQKGDSDERRE